MLRNYSERLHGREATRPDVTYTFNSSVVETTVEMPVLENDPTKPREPKPDYSSIQVGMYYYDDGTFGSEVKSGHMVGVVVIPAAATPDGYVRIAPMSGWLSNLPWSKDVTDIADLEAVGITTIVRSYPNTYKDGTIYESTQSVQPNTLNKGGATFPFIYMELPDEIVNKFDSDITIKQSTLNPALYAPYHTDDIQADGLLPVPYLQDGTVNPDFVVEGTMTSDWTSADENMAVLKDANSNNIFKYTNGFSYGIGAGNWHIPTITELLFMYAKMKTIVNAYTAAGYDNPFYTLTSNSFNYRYLWSSSFMGQYGTDNTSGYALYGYLYSNYGGGVTWSRVNAPDTGAFVIPLATITPKIKTGKITE